MTDRFECSCADCRFGCTHRPGWPTVAEAAALVAAGHGGDLMLDWWSGELSGGADVLMLVPAIVGSEGGQAPVYPVGRCAFLDRDERCSVHALKPTECAEAGCRGAHGDGDAYLEWRDREIAMTWHSDAGRALVAEWCAARGVVPDTAPTIDGMLELLAGLLGGYRDDT